MSPLPSGNSCLVEAAGCWRQWVWLAACNLLVLSQAFGAPGDLDPSFGSGGKLITSIGSDDDEGHAVAVQADGKIVVAGYARNGDNKDFALARYNADGSLDASFGGTGKVTTEFGGFYDYGQTIAVQFDGKIIVAGFSSNGGNYDFAVARYNADGSLDTSFAGTGNVTTPIGSSDDYGESVVVQVDGKIVVAGSSTGAPGPSDFALVRYNANGSLDTSFNGTGKVTTPITIADRGNSIAVEADGKIVVAGYSTSAPGYTDFALVRYNANGSLDTSFNGTGKVTTPIGSSTDIGHSVAVQADGRIVVAGESYDGSSTHYFAVVRYNANGSLDGSFNGTGKVTTPIGSSHAYGQSVVVQANGKIVVAGYSIGSTSDFALVRYNANGSLDGSFNGTGKVTTPIGNSDDYAQSVAMQADGKIVVAGYSLIGSRYDFALVRYEGDGLAPLANWRLTYFGTTDNSGNAADGAAPDGDGIVNLIKYGLVIAPGTSGASSLPQGQRKVYAEGERLVLVFLHDPARNDISIEVQAADQSEGPWTTVASSAGGALFSGAGFVSETGAGGGLNTVEVRDLVNLAAAPHRYMHIKVTH